MKTLTLAGAALAATVLLAGCGGDDSSAAGGTDDGATEETAFVDQEAEAIAQAGKDAMAGLESVRVSGAITSDGQDIALDLALSTSGECDGSISVGGGTAELLGTDGQVWFRADDAFWTASAGEQAPTIIDLVDGRWVVVAPDDDSFGQFCNLQELLDELVSDEDDGDTYEKGEVSDVDGTEAIAITGTDVESGPSIGYVQVEGEHYLLKMVREEGDEPGEITFSGFNEPVEAKAPAEEDTVNLDELGG